jgi:hypothetical protein
MPSTLHALRAAAHCSPACSDRQLGAHTQCICPHTCTP